ncbi:PsiF family protein [Rhodocyclaceae bacterium]
MKKVFATALLLATHFTVMPQIAFAEDKPATPQQQRMRDCNKDAAGMKGDERKGFMKQCLGGKQAAAKDARSVQQEKMKTCNANAATKGLKGPERKAFMSDCLKN